MIIKFFFMVLAFNLLALNFCFSLTFETEIRLVKEFGDLNYGYYFNLVFDFNKHKKKLKAELPFLEKAFISATEMDEIRNQINYMLEAEDDANEEAVDFIDEFYDPAAELDGS